LPVASKLCQECFEAARCFWKPSRVARGLFTVARALKTVLKLPDPSGSHRELSEASELFQEGFEAARSFWKTFWVCQRPPEAILTALFEVSGFCCFERSGGSLFRHFPRNSVPNLLKNISETKHYNNFLGHCVDLGMHHHMT